MGDKEFIEKARSIATPRKWGSKKMTPVQREDDGTHGGLQIEHWNDRVDAVVRPKPIDVELNVKNPGD
jgi:hypothetical protein